MARKVKKAESIKPTQTFFQAKRGEITVTAAAGIILVLAAALIMYPFAGEAGAETRNQIDDTTCLTSIKLLTSERENIISASLFQTRIDCPTDQKEFEGTEEQIIEQIAKELVGCWEKTGGQTNHVGVRGQDTNLDFSLECTRFTTTKEINTDKIITFLKEKKHKNNETYEQKLDTSYSIKGIFMTQPEKTQLIISPQDESQGKVTQLKTLFPKTSAGGNTYMIIVTNPAASHNDETYNHIFIMDVNNRGALKQTPVYQPKK